jgi:hypothetical protein
MIFHWFADGDPAGTSLHYSYAAGGACDAYTTTTAASKGGTSTTVVKDRHFGLNDLAFWACVLLPSVLLLACFRFRSKHLQKQWRLHISVHSRLHYVGTQKLAVPEAVAQGEYHFFLSHVCAAAFRPRVVRDVPTYGHTRACGDGAQAWTTGANQMRICKERLKVLCPDVVVFLECDGRDSRSVSRSVKASRPVWPPQRLAALSPPPSKLELALRSVDDLRMGMGAEYVERSRAFIFFVSSGYFDSCSRLAVARTLDSQAGAVDRCWTGAMIAHSRRQTAFASF